MPLVVRPNGTRETFEIVAGRRRYFAAKSLADERGEGDALPCAIREDGGDADALEASLIENIARLNSDEVSQWETFSRLIREGRTIADYAVTFGITELQVKRILALGDLIPKIREAYLRDEIDTETVRYLTMASKAQQKDWLALFADPDKYTPRGSAKAMAVRRAVDFHQGGAVCHRGLSRPDHPRSVRRGQLFRRCRPVLEKAEPSDCRQARRLSRGWMERSDRAPTGPVFPLMGPQKTPRKKGSKVFMSVSHRGAVECHEGWLSRKEARRAARKARAASTKKPPQSRRDRNSPGRCRTMSICIAMPRCARPCSTIRVSRYA